MSGGEGGFWCSRHELKGRIAEMGAGAFAVLTVLQSHADERNQAWPSIAQLATETGISARSIHRHLNRLRDLGLVSWEQCQDGHGGQTSNRYRLAGAARRPKSAPTPHAKMADPPMPKWQTPHDTRVIPPMTLVSPPSLEQESLNKSHEGDSHARAPEDTQNSPVRPDDPRMRLLPWQRREIARYLGGGLTELEATWAIEALADFEGIDQARLAAAVDNALAWAQRTGHRITGMKPLIRSLRETRPQRAPAPVEVSPPPPALVRLRPLTPEERMDLNIEEARLRGSGWDEERLRSWRRQELVALGVVANGNGTAAG